jgi:hypothetical protein
MYGSKRNGIDGVAACPMPRAVCSAIATRKASQAVFDTIGLATSNERQLMADTVEKLLFG